MPVVTRDQVGEYYLLNSRHFFQNQYIITNSVSFNESIAFQSPLIDYRLIGEAGAGMLTATTQNVNYGNVLNMPILITENRNLPRNWVDGLDFLNLIFGENLQSIDNIDTNIFGTSPYLINGQYNIFFDQYDMSTVKSIAINFTSGGPISIAVSLYSNVENVFQFVTDNGVLINPDLNDNPMYLQESRPASKIDCIIAFQNYNKMFSNPLMPSSTFEIDFEVETIYIHGAGRALPLFLYNNYKISGTYNVIDNITYYLNNPGALYPINSQNYNQLTIESSSATYNDLAFGFYFPEIDGSNFNFSNHSVVLGVNRAITNGVLASQITFQSYGTLIA